MKEYEFVIIGSGIIGLSVARAMVKSGYKDIAIIEKESEPGKHASGRNSGVLHAGIYYTQDSLKAKYSISGNEQLTKFCSDNSLSINKCGKVIVAKDSTELAPLHELYSRAMANGCKVDMISEETLKKIEPYAITHKEAIHSPLTSVVNPKQIVSKIREDLIDSGVKVYTQTKFIKRAKESSFISNQGEFKYSTLINAAGAFADKIAHEYGVSPELKFIPFKGTYLQLREEKSYLVNGNVYPVPNIENPFLGVHFTRGISGLVTIGPTAIPALGRENYGILRGISPEMISFLYTEAMMFIKNKKFRTLATQEPKKYFKWLVYKEVKKMLNNVKYSDIISSPKVGIRPQLVNWKTKELVMDFKVEKVENTIHVLNAISPAFTGSFALAEDIVKNKVLT